MRYENGAGTPGQPPSEWPRQTRIPRSSGKFTLVMMAHPDCPCSRASLTELERLIPRVPGRMDVFVVFRKPESTADEIRTSILWKKAQGISGVTLIHDADGAETQRFGAQASGQTMLYSPDGRLAFSGGITNARGREGYSKGEDLIVQNVIGTATGGQTSVFGCSLRNPDAKQDDKQME